MKAPWSLMPLMPLTVAFAGGILLSLTTLSVWWAILFLAVAAIFYASGLMYNAILVSFITIGFIDGALNRPEALPDNLYDTRAQYSGIVTQTGEGESTQNIKLSIDSINGIAVNPFNMAIYIPSALPTIDITDRLSFQTTIHRVEAAIDLPDEFDYSKVLARQRIIATAFLPADSIISLYPEPGLINGLIRYRRNITDAIYSSGLNSQASEFLATILTGDTSELNQDTRDRFNRAGLAHILAISGLHVGIIAWLISLMLWPVYIAGFRQTRFILTIAGLWIFAIMTGLPASVIRAVIMATVFLIAEIAGRRYSPINSLSFAVMLILLFSPDSITMPGFQLSVIAVLSILITIPLINRINRRHTLLYNLTNVIVVPFAAMLGTGIISAFYFHIFPCYFLIANVIISIFLPVILVLGIGLVIMALTSMPHSIIVSILNKSYDIMDSIIDIITRLPGATIDNIWIYPLELIFYFSALAWLLAWIHRQRIFRLIGFAVTAVCGLCISLYTRPDINGHEVYFTRNNSSTDIIVRNNSRMWLITTASNESIRESALRRARHRYADFMSRRGIDSLCIAPQYFSVGTFTRSGNDIHINGKSYTMIHNDTDTPPMETSIIVCTGFRGDIVKLARSAHAREIILSTDLNKRRRERYNSELSSAGIPHSLLADKAPELSTQF